MSAAQIEDLFDGFAVVVFLAADLNNMERQRAVLRVLAGITPPQPHRSEQSLDQHNDQDNDDEQHDQAHLVHPPMNEVELHDLSGSRVPAAHHLVDRCAIIGQRIELVMRGGEGATFSDAIAFLIPVTGIGTQAHHGTSLASVADTSPPPSQVNPSSDTNVP